MMKHTLKYFLISFFCVSCLCLSSQRTYASELEEYAPIFQDDFSTFYLDEAGNARIHWNPSWWPSDASSLTYEVEIASNPEFTEAQKFETQETSLALKKSQFGTNGGKYYCRVRVCDSSAETPVYSNWSETKEFAYVKINKTNFPGLYTLLKKNISDTNEDGWLDPTEIQNIWSLETRSVSKQKNGKWVTTPATKVSSLEGVEYLTNLCSISLDQYSGKKVDLSKNKVTSLTIRGITSTQISVNAPDATYVHIESHFSTKLTKMDLAKCNKAVNLSAYGSNKTKTLKLPSTKKNLKVLSLSDFGFKTLNVNAYTNLQQLYVYKCNLSKAQLNKCKNLRYLYFYFCDKIKNVDISKNTKLRGIDIYSCKGLSKKTVKTYKKTKLTWNKGKWWYSTDAYSKDMNNLYK